MRKDMLILLFVFWKVLSFGRGRTGRLRRRGLTVKLVPAVATRRRGLKVRRQPAAFTIMIRHGEKV